MNPPDLLLFDLGGVLIESAVFEQLNRLLDQPLETESIKARWLSSPSVRQFESGALAVQEFGERFVAEWGLRQAPRDFLQTFASWPRCFFSGAHETLRFLRNRYKVGCLSNSNPLHYQQFDSLEGVFDIALFSHLLGAVKPDPEIFMLALNECGLEPAKVYYFDDCLFNVYAAQSLGITAFHVDGFEALLNVLNAKGLLAGNRSVHADTKVLENG